MTTLREAAQQALEALTAHADLHSTMYMKLDAITALRAALEQPEHKPMHPEIRKMWEDYFDKCFRRQPLTRDETMRLANETAGAHWCDEAHLQRFRAAVERAHGIGGSDE